MKIAIISTIQGCTWAGTEEVWFHLARNALELGHEVMVGTDQLIAASEHVSKLEMKGLRVASRRPFRPMKLYLVKERWWPDLRDLERFSPDVLLINAGSPLDLSFLPYVENFCKRLHCPKLFFCHFNSDRLQFGNRNAIRESLLSMDGFIFVNKRNRQELERQLASHLPNSHVILNSSRVFKDEPLPYPPGPTVRFVNVARLESYWKGQDILFEIFSQPPWTERDWTLECFGTGPENNYLSRLISFYGLDEKVFLAGYERSLDAIWKDRHVLLLPSRGEGTPLVTVEAMMYGRPVVTTDVGGNAEVLEDGVTGFIADAATPVSFGKALDRAWQTRERWMEMGVKAHDHAKKLTSDDPASRLFELVKRSASK